MSYDTDESNCGTLRFHATAHGNRQFPPIRMETPKEITNSSGPVFDHCGGGQPS